MIFATAFNTSETEVTKSGYSQIIFRPSGGNYDRPTDCHAIDNRVFNMTECMFMTKC